MTLGGIRTAAAALGLSLISKDDALKFWLKEVV
jgi:hypothetical protein